MNCKYAFIWILFYYVNCSAANIAYKRPCEDLSEECLTKSLQLAVPYFIGGIPEFGLETLDPYYIERLDLTLPGGIAIEFTKGLARGLKRCVVDFARLYLKDVSLHCYDNGPSWMYRNLNKDNHGITILNTYEFQGDTFVNQVHCNLTIKGKYKSKGRMLMFPIDGEGDSTIRCHNLRLHSILKLRSKVGSDGQKYLEIKNSSVTHSYDGRVTYSMTNLFKRNPEINKAVLDFMNNNWRMIAEEFGKPMVEYGANCVLKNLKQLLKVLPLNKIVTVPVDI